MTAAVLAGQAGPHYAPPIHHVGDPVADAHAASATRRLALPGSGVVAATTGNREARGDRMASVTELFFDGAATWFTVPAIVGTGGFLVRLALASFAGADHGGDAGGGDVGGHDGGSGADHSSDVGAHNDIAATTISIQGVLTFLMGFGWAGLGGYRGADLSPGLSALVGTGTGLVFLAMSVVMLRASRKLQSSGNVSIGDLVGREAEVYSIVPAAGQGQGQIRAVVGDRQRFVYAVSEGAELPTRTRVVIVRANPDNTLTVRRA